MRNGTLAWVALAVAASGCAGVPGPRQEPVKFRNGSTVDLRLANRGAEMVWHAVRAQGCPVITEIAPTPLIRSEEFAFDNATSNVARGMTVERWIASGCGTTYEFEVSFIADGRGSTDITVLTLKR